MFGRRLTANLNQKGTEEKPRAQRECLASQARWARNHSAAKTKATTAITHHDGGRQARTPVHRPRENASAAQNNGWRGGLWLRFIGHNGGPGVLELDGAEPRHAQTRLKRARLSGGTGRRESGQRASSITDSM